MCDKKCQALQNWSLLPCQIQKRVIIIAFILVGGTTPCKYRWHDLVPNCYRDGAENHRDNCKNHRDEGVAPTMCSTRNVKKQAMPAFLCRRHAPVPIFMLITTRAKTIATIAKTIAIIITTIIATSLLQYYQNFNLPKLPPRFTACQIAGGRCVARCRRRIGGTCYFEFSAAFFKPSKPAS